LSMPGSIASLDSSSSSEDSYDHEEEARIAQQEWEESLQQFQRIVSAILLPYIGKYLGRNFSYWAFSRYLRLGLGKSFFWSGV